MSAPFPTVWLTRWLAVQAGLWTGVLAAAAVAPELAARSDGRVLMAAGVAGSWVLLLVVLRSWRTAADLVTGMRLLGLVATLLGWPLLPPWWRWALLVVVVAADLVDGALARRFGGSAAGAVLDMETDQFTVLVLAWLVLADGGARWVLLLPAMRPLFVLAMTLLRRPAHEPKPKNGDNRRGRRVCAAVLVALLVALLPGLPRAVGDAGTAIAVLLLSWSFADDARWLLRRGRR